MVVGRHRHFADGRLRVYLGTPARLQVYGTYAVPDPAEDEKTLDLRVDPVIAAQPALAEAA